ncbi:GNAT superfamily N-acetyltransferase [Lipingzhangella halophila]|uniref:GNAT superfamily N-acetyltransferase n=1 Tax=Lipingzhangella halophila TaxID=1783352 RepID=A0A7W7W523_9ACTN|nr:GNAT family N-acetyltransferase [Lipingzhangella halophila]MBB4933315.1 GNAT superfamily N-acetyltransferase [Lipingzhangella halophila]
MTEWRAAGFDSVLREFWALGGQRRTVDGAVCVRNRDAPLVGRSNAVYGLSGDDPAAIARTLSAACEWISSPRVRAHAGPAMDPATEAALPLAGWGLASTQVTLLLTGACPRPDRRQCEIRAAATEADWRRIAELLRLDHEEEDRKAGRVPRPAGDTAQTLRAFRATTPDVRFWIAWDGGTPAGFFASWPRSGETAMVEDLFVRPTHRGQGIASHLLHHAVADARTNGAGPVLIRADSDDWPKDFYHRRGFQPVSTVRWYRPSAGWRAAGSA